MRARRTKRLEEEPQPVPADQVYNRLALELPCPDGRAGSVVASVNGDASHERGQADRGWCRFWPPAAAAHPDHDHGHLFTALAGRIRRSLSNRQVLRTCVHLNNTLITVVVAIAAGKPVAYYLLRRDHRYIIWWTPSPIYTIVLPRRWPGWRC